MVSDMSDHAANGSILITLVAVSGLVKEFDTVIVQYSFSPVESRNSSRSNENTAIENLASFG